MGAEGKGGLSLVSPELMKRRNGMKLMNGLMTVVIFFSVSGFLRADQSPPTAPEKVSFLQLSLFPPLQLADVDTTIKGFPYTV